MTRPIVLAALFCVAAVPAQSPIDLRSGDRVVFVGNTFAERLALFSNFEAMLTAARPGLGLTFRNLGWSADTLTLKPRPMAFGSEEEHLRAQHADVVVACYGMNEAFEGEAGLATFAAELDAWVERTLAADYNHDRAGEVVISEQRRFGGIDDGREDDRPVRVILVSPIAHEDLGGALPDPTTHNQWLGRYTSAMRDVAQRRGVPLVDLFSPTSRWYVDHPDRRLTINGIHLDEYGDWVVARMMMSALGFDVTGGGSTAGDDLRAQIVGKNRLWFHRWRAVNGFYIYGGRKEPFGVRNFPGEMSELERLIGEAEREIAVAARALDGGAGAIPAPEVTR